MFLDFLQRDGLLDWRRWNQGVRPLTSAVGSEVIAATLQEETDTLVDRVESFLLKISFRARMQNGRKAAELAYQHFGIPYSESGRQLSLSTHKKR